MKSFTFFLQLNNISDKKSSLHEEKESLLQRLNAHRSVFDEKEKEVDLLTKECELAKERQVELLGDR